MLTTLLSARIRAEVAVAAARELFAAGWSTPKAMRGSTRQQRVDALGRGHYVRYDESTARALAETAERVLETYRGDLRRMADAAGQDPARLHGLLSEFARIGSTGAEVFCREAQAVGPWLRPYFDKRARTAARRLGRTTPPNSAARYPAGTMRAWPPPWSAPPWPPRKPDTTTERNNGVDN